MCKGPETGRVRGRKEVESGGWAEMGPLMKPEEVSRVQGKRREEEPTRCVRNALEETEVCGMLCVCSCVCVRAVGPLGGCRGQHPRPPAGNHAHRCAAGIPTDADTPALECQQPAGGRSSCF